MRLLIIRWVGFVLPLLLIILAVELLERELDRLYRTAMGGIEPPSTDGRLLTGSHLRVRALLK